MTEIVVRTQQEFDAALNEPANHAIMIASEENMLLNVSSTVGKIVSARSGRLRVCGNARGAPRASGDDPHTANQYSESVACTPRERG